MSLTGNEPINPINSLDGLMFNKRNDSSFIEGGSLYSGLTTRQLIAIEVLKALIIAGWHVRDQYTFETADYAAAQMIAQLNKTT